MFVTDFVNATIYFESGIYPCRCGETHRWRSRLDYGHHNCLHKEGLWLDSSVGPFCRDHGQIFSVSGVMPCELNGVLAAADDS